LHFILASALAFINTVGIAFYRHSIAMISLLYAHPYAHLARMERLMLNEVQKWPGLELRDLYQLYPDFYIDVALEQKMLLHSRAIILHYPLQLGFPPALLVQYLHKVFQHGWAYGAADADALQGKTLWLVTRATTKAQQPSLAEAQALFAPVERLALSCGMQWQQPLLMSELTNRSEVAQAAELYLQGLQQLPDSDASARGSYAS
jgi:putative NADPH-quinone reductase